MTCFLNGQFLREEEAFVPINDRGFLFGDGVFTTIRVSDGLIEFFDEHIERLKSQCVALNIIPPEVDRAALEKLIDLNQAMSGVWRLKVVITGGCEPHLNLSLRDHGFLLITLKPFIEEVITPKLTVYPESIYHPLSTVKTLSYLDRLCVKQYAQKNGFDDAIVRSCEGYFLETAFSNIYWLDGGEIFTPSDELPLMQGIMLQSVIKKAPRVTFVKVKEIPKNVELFCCNCLMGSVKSLLLTP